MRSAGLFLTPLLLGVANGGKFEQRPDLTRFADDSGHDGGIGALRPICEEHDCPSSSDELVSAELIAALESQDQVIGVKSVELGELLCDTLDEAPDSPWLRFQISSKQAVFAERTSFSTLDGGIFTDGQDRKIWVGEVVDSAHTNVSVPGSISMTWTDLCDVETFLLKMVTPNADGTTSIVTSMPCSAGSNQDLCMVEMEVEQPMEQAPPEMMGEEGSVRRRLRSAGGRSKDEPAADSDDKAKDEDIRMLTEYLLSATDPEREDFHELGLQRLNGGDVMMPSGRRLQGATRIDLMILYSESALAARRWTEGEMETNLGVVNMYMNEAFQFSGIALEVALVHTALLPGDYRLTGSVNSELDRLRDLPEVVELREKYSADLVQLVDIFDSSEGYSGKADLPTGRTSSSTKDSHAFSVVDARFLEIAFTPTHELGHNFGCFHDRSNSGVPTSYFGYNLGEQQCSWAICNFGLGPNGQSVCQGVPFRTIMSYPCASIAVAPLNRFSNPEGLVFDNPYPGSPYRAIGTATTNNARTIRENMVAIANYRG